MTQEEKAKAYDKAIEKLRSLHDNYDTVSTLIDIKEELEAIFPELKESEDERIRKELIEKVKETPACIGFNDKNAVLAWLEKQESVGEIVSRCKTSWYNEGKIQGQIEGLSDEEKYQQGWHDALKKQDEKNHTDNVEPKFHEGDWVVLSTSDEEKVVHIDSVEYFKSGEPRYITSEGRWFGNGTKAHLWTIQDAKDGDVVVEKSDGAIGIFQSIGHHVFGGCCNDPSYCFLHCRYDDGFFYANFEHGNTIDSPDLIPATKEQRNLLFTKMKEAGYEWDTEKKELKKIEDNAIEPDDLIEESYQQQADDLIGMVTEKPAWSEEDEDMCYKATAVINRLCAEGKEYVWSNKTLRKLFYWLKSLKDKVQPKQEWSEEDKGNLLDVKCIIDKVWHNQDIREEIDHSSEKLESLWHWLDNIWQKVTYPQKQWKPSDEQIKALEDAIEFLGCTKKVREDLKSLHEQLKKLRENKL